MCRIGSRMPTHFVASTATDWAADVSHRGGKLGLLRAVDKTLFIPDYNGNSMFCTLGNFLHHPRAGLVFVDFDTNRTLQLTGDVELELEPRGVMRGAADTGRSWKFPARQYVISSMGSRVSAEIINASPFNLTISGST